MARKKIVFIIVEGPSDAEALEAILNNIFDREEVYVYIQHGDITTQKEVHANNILNNIGRMVKKYLNSTHFKVTDIKEIIHIVDMDGAYISDDNIIEDNSVSRTIYQEKKILTKNVKALSNRNKQKSMNMDKLSLTSVISRIKYSVYYMSCNLDHVLYNIQNSNDKEKTKNSIKFAKKYKDNPIEFLNFITNSDFSVKTDYQGSWEYIREDFHSLERHTNLGLIWSEKGYNNDDDF